MAANASAPQELAALFTPYLDLLQLDPVEHANTFAAGTATQQNQLFLWCLHQQLLADCSPDKERWHVAQPLTHMLCACADAGGMAAPDLEKFGQEVERLQLAAQEVDMLCTHTVRTGTHYMHA